MINTTAVYNQFLGTGLTTVFPSTVYGLFAEQFEVYLGTDILTGAKLVLNTDYTLTNLASPAETGVVINMAIAPLSGQYLRLYRRTFPTQSLNVTQSRAYDPKGIEDTLDLLTMALQESLARSNSAIQVRGTTSPFTPTDGCTLIWDAATNSFIPGPELALVANLGGIASEVEADRVAAAASALAAQAAAALLGAWRGPWTAVTAYAAGDRVSNAGSTYYAKTAHTSTSSFATDLITRWGIIAEKGAAGPGTGDVLGANNGTDFTNAAAFRNNLGLAIGTHIQAYSARLAAIAANNVRLSDFDPNAIRTAAEGMDYSDDTFSTTRAIVDYVGSQTLNSWRYAWHPYNKNAEADVVDPTFYNFAVNGLQASITTPDFVDGYEYMILGVNVTFNAGASTNVNLNLYGETSGSFSSNMVMFPSTSAATIHDFMLEILAPRKATFRTLVRKNARALAAGNGVTTNGANVETYLESRATAQKRLRARLLPSSGSFSGGIVSLYRRKTQ